MTIQGAHKMNESQIELTTIQKGLEKIAGGGWYLDRYRSALKLAETGALPNDMIYITDSVYEANRRYDNETKTWQT